MIHACSVNNCKLPPTLEESMYVCKVEYGTYQSTDCHASIAFWASIIWLLLGHRQPVAASHNTGFSFSTGCCWDGKLSTKPDCSTLRYSWWCNNLSCTELCLCSIDGECANKEDLNIENTDSDSDESKIRDNVDFEMNIV